VREWVDQLNQFKEEQVQEWTQEPSWSAADASPLGEVSADKLRRMLGKDVSVSAEKTYMVWKTNDGRELSGGGQLLQDYGLFTDRGPTVVLGRHLEPTGMPMLVPDKAIESLTRCGIDRVVLGHTPHGICPTITKSTVGALPSPRSTAPGADSTHAGLMVVMADTSFSDVKAPDCRGNAVSEVLLLDDGQVHVECTLPHGMELSYTLLAGMGEPDEPNLVGLPVPTITSSLKAAVGTVVNNALGDQAYFVKAYLETEGMYMLQHVNGFVNKYVFLRPQEVRQMFNIDEGHVLTPGDPQSLTPSPAPATVALNPLIQLNQFDELAGQEGTALAVETIEQQMETLNKDMDASLDTEIKRISQIREDFTARQKESENAVCILCGRPHNDIHLKDVD